MNKDTRSFTGLVVLAAILVAIAYLWKPWTEDPALRLGLDLQGGLRVVLQADEDNPLHEDLIAARSVLENRINEFGVAEPLIQTSGNNRIVVELPGLSSEDQDRALDLIGQQAVLEFRLVNVISDGKADSAMTLSDLEEVAFTGEVLSNASTGFDRFNRPTVLFDIQRNFVSDFTRFTSENMGRRMAIVLDGTVMSAPRLQTTISESGQIEGMESVEAASDLALVLRSGSLPISFHVEEIRAVGPTLGQDSVVAGRTAALIGGSAVVLVIILYYGPLFGIVLTIGLSLAMLFIFGILSGFNAVLTLPGLAGLILTIGAAVDGNVISFERIKEEMRMGKGLRVAMRNGFNNSLSAIIDANLTTLLAAVALYQYTSGPVRGFAVTLALGIIAAVFVNTVVVPFILNVLTLRITKARMPRTLHFTGLKFVSKAPIILSISGLLALAAIGLVTVRGVNPSTDFTGGTSLLLSVPDGTSVDDVRTSIDAIAFEGISGNNAVVQEIIDSTIQGNLISVRVGIDQTGNSDSFAAALAESLEAESLQTDFVGPAVGEELTQAAIMAVLVAIALILIYVGWRFWPNWIIAIAAIIAVIHDVALVLGFNNVYGAEFSIPVLAAILFVVGYSLNDSIIISDRIRENLRKIRGSSYEDIVDLSVNQTLSRTLVTSGTTLLPILALFFFGGSVLREFSITLLLGIAVGTYSSIFILSPMVVWFKNRQRNTRAQKGVVRSANV